MFQIQGYWNIQQQKTSIFLLQMRRVRPDLQDIAYVLSLRVITFFCAYKSTNPNMYLYIFPGRFTLFWIVLFPENLSRRSPDRNNFE